MSVRNKIILAVCVFSVPYSWTYIVGDRHVLNECNFKFELIFTLAEVFFVVKIILTLINETAHLSRYSVGGAHQFILLWIKRDYLPGIARPITWIGSPRIIIIVWRLVTHPSDIFISCNTKTHVSLFFSEIRYHILNWYMS